LAEVSEPPVLRIAGVTKRFGPLVANDTISLEVRPREVVALLGENGAGKTTLMSILFGHYVADEGEIEAFGRKLPAGSPAAAIAAGIGMVHQHFTLADNLSVLDNIVLGTEPLWQAWSDRRRARRRIEETARSFGLEVDSEKFVGDLSVGERQRVEILKALYRDARILILDEPTAVLTPQESDRLFVTLKKLVEGGLSVIFISHKLREVMAVSDRVAVLRQGKLVAERPTIGTNPAELAALMVGREVRPPVREPLEPGAPVLELRGLGFTDAEGHRRLDGIDLVVREREIVGIAGVSGNGQSALADVLSGTSRRSQGEVLLFGAAIGAPDPADLVGRGIGRIPEDRHRTGVVGDMSVWENGIAEELRSSAFSRGGILRRGAAREHARGVIEEFSVACPSEEAPIRLLSGGNMQKLILGRVLTREPRFILASQPTRGLDIGAVAYIHRRLLAARAAGAGILLISEDLDEILLLADRIAVIYRGHLSPALAHDAVTVPMLGAMMAGRLDGEAHAA